MSINLALKKLKQGDGKFEANMNYVVSSRLDETIVKTNASPRRNKYVFF